eukprot:TRINITY_DN110597_c0_g1_i1.p1 TRINITY_DN110597_c0_g1~~TRINITY_DN110597_c0_g1_i1.p1  ORF type:complete len:317 (-),score=69.78 TRINITY_DN110597_c0_g1_i1:248-1198(-)
MAHDDRSTLRLVDSGKLTGPDFGESAFKIYEAGGEMAETPYVFVWLHGADMGEIDTGSLRKMHEKLMRRTFFFVPMNPKGAAGLKFSWGVAHTKAQNKNSCGFVNGQRHDNYLKALTMRISKLSCEQDAERVVVCGYSMGGFGAYQLGSFAPDTFDAVISVAGYGHGTLQPADQGYHAPQPQSSVIFKNFLQKEIAKLSHVPVVMCVHAQSDTISYFEDNRQIIECVERVNRKRGRKGFAKLTEVPEHHADSDPGRKKKAKQGHSYFNYTLLNPTSEGIVWKPLRDAFCSARLRGELRVPLTPTERPELPELADLP